MSIDNIEVEALKLSAPARARLAEKLLESLEHLSPDENQQVWAEEAERRDAATVGRWLDRSLCHWNLQEARLTAAMVHSNVRDAGVLAGF